MLNQPNWFNESEYADFLAESSMLWEMNIPLQKQKLENRKKLFQFKANKARQEGILKMELARDAARAKAKGALMGLGESRKEQLMNNFFDKLIEERTPIKAEKRKMRPEVNPGDRERDRKREERRQDGQESVLKRIIIVKNNRRNKIEIIPKDDYNADIHTILKGKVKKIDKGNISQRDLKYYSSLDNFINTKTSIRLLGKIEKEKKSTKKQKSKTTSSFPSSEAVSSAPPPPPRMRAPKDGKEITDPASSYADWDHNINQLSYAIPDAFSVMNGKKPSAEYEQLVSNSRTIGDSLQRLVKQILNNSPQTANMKFDAVPPTVKVGKAWSVYGMKEAQPNATFIGVDKQQKQTMGFAVKIGEQIKPTLRGEANFVLNTSMASIPQEELIASFGPFVDDFIQNLRISYSAIRTPPPVQVDRQGEMKLQTIKWKQKSAEMDQKKLIEKAADMFETFFNQNEELKAAFLLEALTGNIKFEGKLGSAQVMLSARKDGTDAELINIDPNFAMTLAKSKDTDLSLKFQPTPNTSNGFLQNLMQMMVSLNESAIEAVGEIQKVKDQLANPFTFLQMFELALNDAAFRTPIIYSDFYSFSDSGISNTIIMNPGSDKEEEITIPVKNNYNSDGDDENIIEKGADALLESYILSNDYLVEKIKLGEINFIDALSILEEQFSLEEKRNYRKEYDNYHAKPEQRKNRSKRVLANRIMKKKGKISKGDGNDTHHKDGNPQNNSDDNLEVISKSKNRSMNEDHGAGFQGTPELVNKLLQDTPGSGASFVGMKSIPYLESQLDKKLKVKKK